MVGEVEDAVEEVMVAVVPVVVEAQKVEVAARGVVKIITRSNILCA